MINKSTLQIVKVCKNAVEEYERVSQGAITKGGVERKEKFQKLIDGLSHLSPEEAFVKVYDFYSDHKSGRLINFIEGKLMWIAGISAPDLSEGVYKTAEKVRDNDEHLRKMVETVKNTLGFTNEKDEFLLKTFEDLGAEESQAMINCKH